VQSTDLPGVAWRKSSRSNGGSEQTNCVEVAKLPGQVAMRDSKDPAGPVLAFTRAGWRAFLSSVRIGTFS
jgi:Domain of unknown function (DUF397)